MFRDSSFRSGNPGLCGRPLPKHCVMNIVVPLRHRLEALEMGIGLWNPWMSKMECGSSKVGSLLPTGSAISPSTTLFQSHGRTLTLATCNRKRPSFSPVPRNTITRRDGNKRYLILQSPQWFLLTVYGCTLHLEGLKYLWASTSIIKIPIDWSVYNTVIY